MLERGERRRARAAVVARDQDDVGVGLGDAGGDGAHALFADQLHVDPRLVVRALEVVDELGQVFDRVDVVVRRRRDQPDAGRRVAGLGDPGVDLGAGQLAALAGLGALGHLDLEVVGVHQVATRHAETARGDLLDRRARVVPWDRRCRSGLRPRRPSPVLDLPPRRFMAMASVVWASSEIEP